MVVAAIGVLMAIRRTELRAFPRLSCGRPAWSQIDDLAGAAQVIDLSQGGCKLLPQSLEPFVANNVQPGAVIIVELAGVVLRGRLKWATPNYSALGCAFDELISEAMVEQLCGQKAAAE